jgi:hypothetical protein
MGMDIAELAIAIAAVVGPRLMLQVQLSTPEGREALRQAMEQQAYAQRNGSTPTANPEAAAMALEVE